MLSVAIKTIPHSSQRYNTVGDYQTFSGCTTILVSDMGDWRLEFLTGLHELVELSLCKYSGITDKMIDDFDFKFDSDRDLFLGYVEPGDSPEAPYHKQHVVADVIEKMVAVLLSVNWDEYMEIIDKTMLGYLDAKK